MSHRAVGRNGLEEHAAEIAAASQADVGHVLPGVACGFDPHRTGGWVPPELSAAKTSI